MNKTAQSSFVYVTFIRTTPERLWSALTSADFMKEYWLGCHVKTEWKVGAQWQLIYPDGRITDTGEIVELEPQKRLVLKWQNEFKPELRQEGASRLTYLLEPEGDMVRLTVHHEIDRPQSRLIEAVSGGWPLILASLKSLIETGESLAATREWSKGA